MKKYFKVLGLALLAAGAFAFTSCTDDEQVAISEDGITVTFGGYTWKANYTEGYLIEETDGINKDFFSIYATPNDTITPQPCGEDSKYLTFPMLYFQTEADKGNNHGSEVFVQYYEKASNTFAMQDEDNAWDFYGWEKGQEEEDNMNIVVTDYNSSTFVISGTVKGTLYEIDNTQSHTGEMKTLSVVFKNIALEDLGEEKRATLKK